MNQESGENMANKDNKFKSVRPPPVLIHNSLNGFTLIELIIYVSIMTVIITAVIPFSRDMILNGAKSSVQEEVYGSGRYIAERIKSEIRNAKGINSVSGSTLSLQDFVAANDPTVIDLSAGKVRIKQGAGSAINLNSNDTNVTSLTFTNNSSLDNKTKNISYSISLQSTSASTRQEYQADINVSGSAEIRSN